MAKDPTEKSTSVTVNIVVRNFSSQWFLIAQGSGIMSVILHNLDYQFPGLGIISVIVWIYTMLILFLSLAVYASRIKLFPRQVTTAWITDVTETSALASVSITLTTIIDMIVLVCVPAWSPRWGLAAYGLWWFNALLSALACVIIPYIFVKVEQPGVAHITPVILLPLIAALTAAAGGGVVCLNAQISPGLQVPVIIVSFILIGMALPLTLAYDALYLSRLFDGHNMAPQMIYQTFILCGPLGQSSFALQTLGTAASHSFGAYNRGQFLTSMAGQVVSICCTLSGLIVWGFGFFWWVYALVTVGQTLLTQPGGIKATKFTLGCWSVIFPWGVYTVAAVQFGKDVSMQSKAWAIWSTILATTMFVLWLLFTILTWWKVFTGEIFGLNRGWQKYEQREHPKYRQDEPDEKDTPLQSRSNSDP